MSTKKARRDWLMREIDSLLTDPANQVESNGQLAAEVVSTSRDHECLVREIALAAQSGHITFRIKQAKDHHVRAALGSIQHAVAGMPKS
jgi:hypothetical protein